MRFRKARTYGKYPITISILLPYIIILFLQILVGKCPAKLAKGLVLLEYVNCPACMYSYSVEVGLA